MRIQLHVAKGLIPSEGNDNCPKETVICQELVGMLRSQLMKVDNISITDEHPDLIHLFGYDNHAIASYLRRARQLLIPCIITPMSTLQPWNSPHHELPFSHAGLNDTKSLPTTLLLIASSQIEQENLQRQYPKLSVELIGNPIVTTSITSEDYAARIVSLYADLIAVHDQNIRQQIQQKVEALDEPDPNICEILRQTEYIGYQHHRGTIGEQQLIQLSATLTRLNYDESLMAERLEQLSRTSFFAQLETVMQEKDLLTEGFMPIPAQENKMFKE